MRQRVSTASSEEKPASDEPHQERRLFDDDDVACTSAEDAPCGGGDRPALPKGTYLQRLAGPTRQRRNPAATLRSDEVGTDQRQLLPGSHPLLAHTGGERAAAAGV